MDTFYAFLIFMVLLALEMMAGQSWLGAYYRFGIPVYHTRRAMAAKAAVEAAPLPIDKTLQERFKNRPGYPTLRFKLLPGSGRERARVALHETLFEARSGPRYFPVMHSLAEVDHGQGQVRVIGLLNWNVAFLLFYMVYTTIADRGFLFVAVLVALLFILSYLAQAGVNRAVIEELQARQ